MTDRRFATLLAAGSFLVAGHLPAQIEPPSTGGAVAAEHAARMLGHSRRVLVIGAHPDDEDTELITLLVRGEGADAAYLSLNRGEGGQNLIGSELGEALGVLRTEELLSARSLDGGRQFFTRAYDFGYSKTLDDTWAQWPRDSILKDVVRIIRTFQPQVIVSIFGGTPADGHGQHQAAGWAAREAFAAAGDSTRFPELQREEGLAPWRPLKFYRAARFTAAPTMVVLQTGMLDPAVGQSYHQIAMASRSRHRSQDMGVLQTPGPAWTRVTLVEDRTGERHRRALRGGRHDVARRVRDRAVARGAGWRAWTARWRSPAPPVSGGPRGRTSGDSSAPPSRTPTAWCWTPCRIPRTSWPAGRSRCSSPCGTPARSRCARGSRLAGIAGGPASTTVEVPAGQMVTVTDTVRLPATATTEPYFLRLPRDGALYRWGNAPEAGLPASPPLLTAVATIVGRRGAGARGVVPLARPGLRRAAGPPRGRAEGGRAARPPGGGLAAACPGVPADHRDALPRRGRHDLRRGATRVASGLAGAGAAAVRADAKGRRRPR